MRFYYAINHRAILARHKSLSFSVERLRNKRERSALHCCSYQVPFVVATQTAFYYTALRFPPENSRKKSISFSFFSLLHASQAICAIIFRAQFAHRLLHRAPRRENELMECYETLFPVSEKRAEKFPINHRWGVGAKWKFVTGRRNAICNARSRFHENIQNSL